MITLQQHIDELRAELRGCLNLDERNGIAAELADAMAAQQRQNGTAYTKEQP